MTYKSLISLLMIPLVAAGCGGGGSSYTPPPPVISVAVSPTAANVHVTNNKQFMATVLNTTNTAVNWSVSGTGCTGTSCGSISSTGLYTAPTGVPNPDSVTVTATSVADTSKSDTATVSVLAAVIVSVSHPNPNVSAGATEQFTAAVRNAIDSSVTWSVSGPGCAGASCGTITSAGLYTAPSTVPSPSSITVTATSNEDSAKYGTSSAAITSAVVVLSWPNKALVTVTGYEQFGAVVTGSSNTAVNWSVTGTGCSGNTCGTISNAGLYRAPGTVPSPETVMITATSQADLGKSASATVEIVPSDDAHLNGTYAFFYQGFALNAPAQTVGTLVADGHGNITSGVADRTWPASVGGNLLSQPFTGTYTLNAENRGSITIVGSFGVVTYAIALNAAGDKAYLQTFFNTNTRMLGILVKQDTSAFTNAALQGDYVFQLLGADSTYARQAGLGRAHADGNGNMTAGNIDINDGVTVTSNLPFTATYSVATNSRGTLTITASGLGTFNYVIYVISSDRFFLCSIDPIAGNTPLMGGTAFEQSGGPFSNASLNQTTVFDLLGLPAASQPRASIGLLTGDGNGHITGLADINNNNALTLNAAYNATYSINATGRGTITSTTSTLPSMIFYLVSPNKALLMEAPGTALQVGMFEPQVQLTYSNALLIGQFVAGGPNPPPYAANGTVTGMVSYDGAGSYYASLDINSVAGGLVSPSSSGNLNSVAANGRVVCTPVGGGNAYAYLISPVKSVEILGTGMPTSPDDQKHLYKSEQ